MPRRVDVQIVTYNQPEVTTECLKSVLATLPPPEHFDVRVTVLDNGSSDGTADVVAANFPEVDLIREPVDLWVGPAATKMIRRSDAEYVLVLNPDTVVHQDLVTPLVAALDADPRLFMAIPETVGEDGVRQQSSQRFPTLRYEFALQLRGTKLDRLVAPRGHTCAELVTAVRDVPPPAHVAYPMEFVWTTCALLRRAAAEEIGPYDERFKQYDCDLVLCQRAAARGWYAYYAPDLVVTHIGGVSFTPDEKKAYELAARRRYYRVHHGVIASVVYTVGRRGFGILKDVWARGKRSAARP